MEEPEIQTSLVRAIPHGIQVQTLVNGLTLDIYLIVAEADFDQIPEILPKARFEEEGQIHVSSLGQDEEPAEEEIHPGQYGFRRYGAVFLR